MATIDLTEDTFDAVVGNNDFVILDFWAAWCNPCRQFAPIYEVVSEGHPDIVFAKVNTEPEQGIAAAFGIRSIPTLMVFRDQIVVYSEAGMLGRPQLEELIVQARALDMDKVRAEIEAQEDEN